MLFSKEKLLEIAEKGGKKLDESIWFLYNMALELTRRTPLYA